MCQMLQRTPAVSSRTAPEVLFLRFLRLLLALLFLHHGVQSTVAACPSSTSPTNADAAAMVHAWPFLFLLWALSCSSSPAGPLLAEAAPLLAPSLWEPPSPWELPSPPRPGMLRSRKQMHRLACSCLRKHTTADGINPYVPNPKDSGSTTHVKLGTALQESHHQQHYMGGYHNYGPFWAP